MDRKVRLELPTRLINNNECICAYFIESMIVMNQFD